MTKSKIFVARSSGAPPGKIKKFVVRKVHRVCTCSKPKKNQEVQKNNEEVQ